MYRPFHGFGHHLYGKNDKYMGKVKSWMPRNLRVNDVLKTLWLSQKRYVVEGLTNTDLCKPEIVRTNVCKFSRELRIGCTDKTIFNNVCFTDGMYSGRIVLIVLLWCEVYMHDVIQIWTAVVDGSEEWSSQLIFQFKQLERRSLKKEGFQAIRSRDLLKYRSHW